MIERLEPEPRGLYAGPVGYVEAGGDGCWMLGIRAMTVRGRPARLTAGVGIVHGSHPTVELAETNLKLAAVVDALAPADDTDPTFAVAERSPASPAEVGRASGSPGQAFRGVTGHEVAGPGQEGQPALGIARARRHRRLRRNNDVPLAGHHRRGNGDAAEGAVTTAGSSSSNGLLLDHERPGTAAQGVPSSLPSRRRRAGWKPAGRGGRRGIADELPDQGQHPADSHQAGHRQGIADAGGDQPPIESVDTVRGAGPAHQDQAR